VVFFFFFVGSQTFDEINLARYECRNVSLVFVHFNSYSFDRYLINDGMFSSSSSVFSSSLLVDSDSTLLSMVNSADFTLLNKYLFMSYFCV